MGKRNEWMSAPDESTTSACTTFSEGTHADGKRTSIGVCARSITDGTGMSANIARGGLLVTYWLAVTAFAFTSVASIETALTGIENVAFARPCASLFTVVRL